MPDLGQTLLYIPGGMHGRPLVTLRGAGLPTRSFARVTAPEPRASVGHAAHVWCGGACDPRTSDSQYGEGRVYISPSPTPSVYCLGILPSGRRAAQATWPASRGELPSCLCASYISILFATYRVASRTTDVLRVRRWCGCKAIQIKER